MSSVGTPGDAVDPGSVEGPVFGGGGGEVFCLVGKDFPGRVSDSQDRPIGTPSHISDQAIMREFLHMAQVVSGFQFIHVNFIILQKKIIQQRQ